MTGLGKRIYFEPEPNLLPRPGWYVYKLFRMTRGKRGDFTYFFVPEKINFILTPDPNNPTLLVIRRRDILKLRKNNIIKSTYKALRAANQLYDQKYSIPG